MSSVSTTIDARPPHRTSRIATAIAAAMLAAAIFAFDTFSPLEIAVAALYIIVLLMSLYFSDRFGIALIALGCMTLTIAGYWISHGHDHSEGPLLRCIVSLLAIGIAALMCMQIRSADLKVRQSEERYRNIFQGTSVAVWEQDYSAAANACAPFLHEGISGLRQHLTENEDFLRHCWRLVRTIDENDAAMKLLGSLNTARTSPTHGAAEMPESLVAFRDVLIAYLEERHSITVESVIRTPGGERRSTILTATFPTGRSRSVLINAIDVTDKIVAEQALQQSVAELTRVSRIATLGALTASIGHEVNQPLAAVVTNGEAALRWLTRDTPDLDEVKACIHEVAREGRRAGDIIQRLRSLAVKGDLARGPVDINAVLTQIVAMVQRDLTEQQVTTSIDLAPDLPIVSGDQVQLQQVVMNLVSNAIQAMRLTTDKQLKIRSSYDLQQGIRISVTDVGPGIPDDHMKRLFAPFFTTKAEGMGIGLSISRSIIESHHGRIWAERNEDRGTSFHFVIPTHPETGSGDVA